MPHSSANAIVAGITTTNDNDILSFGVDVVPVLQP
jgi:hypothetical protein